MGAPPRTAPLPPVPLGPLRNGAVNRGGGVGDQLDLGGVGHGELWNVSYEGRNFKGMAR